MMKKNGVCILILAVIMLALPAFLVTFVKGECGLVIYFLMLFVINPVAAIVTGVFAGKNFSNACFQPFVLALLFSLGGWIFVGMKVSEVVFYVIIYLVLGCISMLVRVLGAKKFCDKTIKKMLRSKALL